MYADAYLPCVQCVLSFARFHRGDEITWLWLQDRPIGENISPRHLTIFSRLFTLGKLDRGGASLYLSTFNIIGLVSLKMHRARPKRSLTAMALVG